MGDKGDKDDKKPRQQWGAGYAMAPGWLLKKKRAVKDKKTGALVWVLPSANAILVYIHLAMFGQFNPGTALYENARPSAVTLAKGKPSIGYPGIGFSVSTVRRALDELEELGAIIGEPQFDADGGQLPNVYRLVFGSVQPEQSEDEAA